jgi:hypothetical protein
MNYRVGKSEPYANLWKEIFAKTSLGRGDIFAPQDCVGAGGLDLDRFDEWMHALHDATLTKPGLKFWIDAETFVQADWSSAPLKRFARQIEVDSRYAEKTITFAYSHYYSPNNANPAWHVAYEKWVSAGYLGDAVPPAPKGLAARMTPENRVEVSLIATAGMAGNCGYEVLVGDRVVAKIQIPREARAPGQKLTVLVDKANSDASVAYMVRSFDVYGNRSASTPCPWPG